METIPNPFTHKYDLDTLAEALMGKEPQYLNTQTGELQAQASEKTYCLTPLSEETQADIKIQTNAHHLLKTMVLEWLKANNLVPPSLAHIPSGFAPQNPAKIRIQHP